MPLFMAYCHDVPDSAGPRQEHLEAHLAHVEQVVDRVRLGGPLLGEDGRYIGSLLVVEADDLADARALIDEDPYVRAGVWERIELVPFKAVAGTWVGGITWPARSR